MNRLSLLLIPVLAVMACARVPNLAGRWDIVMDPDFKGHPSVEHCVIQQENRSLTVKFGPEVEAAVSEGEVNGHKVRWNYHASGSRGFTASWTGDLDSSGTTIKGTWELTLADGSRERGNFTASHQSR